ncbi:hypothetical protein DPMN_011723 [Dreissena polymorpha]|uniref:MAM domain-containing protein n=1 Tax=Dreissena polymorpha TaxID=45954 RepID=A0A9D4N5N9_DREPO|nr:hypothetical protein DPMN_011723 [Dreissena polymorpha]
MAIDDYQITVGPCAAPASCDFETGLCGYTNVAGDDFDWARDAGGTPSLLTGPKTDHTTNSPQGLNNLFGDFSLKK